MLPTIQTIEPGKKMKVVMVGIAGTSRDILLAPYSLQSYVMGHEDVQDRLDFEVIHHKFILPRNITKEADLIAHQIAALQPELVGFSTYCWNIDAVKRIAGLLRTLAPCAKILLGGPEIDAGDMMKGVYDKEPYDFIIHGEGEIAFISLIRCFLFPEQNQVAKVPRLGFNTPHGFESIPLPDKLASLVSDLKTLPSPFLTRTIPEHLLQDPRVSVNIETQRGCNLRCAYCLYHANFPKIRYRDVQTVLEELQYLKSQGVQHFRITDANFFSDHDYAVSFLQGIVDNRFEMSIFIEVIPVFVDEVVANLMAQYRAISPKNQITVGLGLQTINEKSLKTIHRNISVTHFDRAFALLSKAKVIIKTDLILGLPFETRATYMQLMEYISEKMRYGYNYLSLALLRLLPGTELRDIAERYKFVVDKRDSDHFIYSTQDISRTELIDCLRVSSVAFRLFHTQEDEARAEIRDYYFSVKDHLKLSHVEMLAHFAKYFLDVLKGQDSDYVREDFPNAEHYWYYDNHKEISDQVIREELDRMRTTVTV
jgi:radical SAM superfamily enzyme YgiQ (UPF0313 family)